MAKTFGGSAWESNPKLPSESCDIKGFFSSSDSEKIANGGQMFNVLNRRQQQRMSNESLIRSLMKRRGTQEGMAKKHEFCSGDKNW